MTSISAQLSALARNALRWQHSHSLHDAAFKQTSAQPVCCVLLQNAAPHTISDAQLSSCVNHTDVSSFRVGHGRHHDDEQLQPIRHTCNQVSPPNCATSASVSCSNANTAVCLDDTVRQHRQSPYSTQWGMQSPSHLQPMLSRLHATPQHIRHISSTTTCWRSPQSNQDAPHARGPMPRPMYQTPPLQSGRGFANPEHEPQQPSRQAHYPERQRAPFQRSAPPHARQPGETRA